MKDQIKSAIKTVIENHCDGTYNGLQNTSNIVWDTNPLDLVEELNQAVLSIIKQYDLSNYE